jgi:hypothetical protein
VCHTSSDCPDGGTCKPYAARNIMLCY